MAQAVLALGAALVTTAGSVWYLPALVDLRSGADRPDSRRTAAAACLSGWATVAVTAVLLLATETWWMPCAIAAAGASVTAGFRIRAAQQRRHETRETIRDWAELRQGPPRVGAHHSRYVLAALMVAGLVAATAAEILLVAAGPAARWDWATIAAPAVVVGVFLAVPIGRAAVTRRGEES